MHLADMNYQTFLFSVLQLSLDMGLLGYPTLLGEDVLQVGVKPEMRTGPSCGTLTDVDFLHSHVLDSVLLLHLASKAPSNTDFRI